MLKKLHIQNFVTIDDISIDFYDGLSIITGETGAGKSLMIDSLSLLLGERASLDMIRQGEDKAIIEGVFIENNPFLKAFLNKIGVIETEEIHIKRIISSLKSSAKINDINVSVNDLKVVGSYLADIHLQFEVTKIFDAENYLGIVDGFKQDLINEYLEKYHKSLEELLLQKQKYEDLVKHKEEVEKNRDDLNDELKEIESFGLYAGYEKDIENKISLLVNYDKIYELIEKTKLLIDENGIDSIYEIKENVSSLSEYQNEYVDYSKRLDDLYIELVDILHELRKSFDNNDYDPNELETLEDNLSNFRQLKKKYKLDEDGLIIYRIVATDVARNIGCCTVRKDDFAILHSITYCIVIIEDIWVFQDFLVSIETVNTDTDVEDKVFESELILEVTCHVDRSE